MNPQLKIPFYAKASLISIGMFAFVAALYITQSIVVPIIYATIIAAALSPVVDFFVRKNINRVLAITLTLTIGLLISTIIITLLLSQASMFSDSFPKLLIQLDLLFGQTKAWVSTTFHISTPTINAWIDETNAELLSSSRLVIGQTLVNIGSVLIIIVLIPVYVFMILYYKPLLTEFIHKLFGATKYGTVDQLLTSTKKIIQSYLVGLSIEAIIVAVMNSAGLLILGIDYAILLGAIGAILNIIPYLGGIIAVALPMLIALATKPPIYALFVLLLYIIIQLIDNNIIIPKVVASKVQINALVSIVVVLVGGALWGIPGMFLSIPLTAIIKLICDQIDGLKPWGYLLGNTVPTESKLKFSFMKKLTK